MAQNFKNYVERIAHREKDRRRDAILDILREEEIPFSLRRIKENEHWTENIVISFPPFTRRLVLGAHYDNVEGSSAANDNASGVSILIHLAKYLLETGRTNIEIVFFDREEYGDHGSSAYIQETGAGEISGMVNLDMCGYGDALYILTKGNVNNKDFYRITAEERLAADYIHTIERVPFRMGDDDTFDFYHVPNIAMSVLPREEIVFLAGFLEKKLQGEPITPEEQDTYANLSYSQTMHNGPLDSVDSVSEETMRMVYQYLKEGFE